jgi:hypothetical protein
MLHPSTFEYLQPTPSQKTMMGVARNKVAAFARDLNALLPDGADKTYVLRKLRELGMWVNVAITREADGTPRE